MSDPREISLVFDGEQLVEFMPREEYWSFCEKMQEKIGPDLEKQRIARLRSEEDAREHIVY